MKLYWEQIPQIARDILRQLTASGDIEVEDVQEAQLDVEAVLKEYVRWDRDLADRAKHTMEQRSLSHEQFGKIKRGLAQERGLADDEEVVAYLTNQLYEMFMRSDHIAEVFIEEGPLRRKIQALLQGHAKIDEVLDQEVRQRIKNLQEGTASWEIEYKKAMEQVKRKHHLG